MKTIATPLALLLCVCLHVSFGIHHFKRRFTSSIHHPVGLYYVGYKDNSQSNRVEPIRIHKTVDDPKGIEGLSNREQLEGLFTQTLEDEFLPQPDITAAGERIDDDISWNDGRFDVVNNVDVKNQISFGEDNEFENKVLWPSSPPKEEYVENALSQAIFGPLSALNNKPRQLTVKQKAAKFAAEKLLVMVTRECVVGKTCSDDVDCCIDHSCRRYTDKRKGVCFPRCDYPVKELGSCNVCACEEGLQCTEVPLPPKPYENVCLKSIKKASNPCSDNNQCKPGECCMVQRGAEEDTATCEPALTSRDRCDHVQPHPFMNMFVGSCPCNHSDGLMCIEGLCNTRM